MISMMVNKKTAKLDIKSQCEVFSRCDVLIINKTGGAGDILCARLIFEDLKKIPKIGKISFAIPRKYLPLIKDHPYIDLKLAVEDLTQEDYNSYAFIKDITYTPDNLEYRMRPFITKNRSDIYADSVGVNLKTHDGCLAFTSSEIEFAQNFLKQYGKGKKIGVAPFTSHISKDLKIQLVREFVSWCQQKEITPLIFHNHKNINIEGVVTINSLTLREWMSVVSMLDAVVTASTAMFWVTQLVCIPTIVVSGFEDALVFGKYHPNLKIVQRRATNNKKPYSTIIQKQELKKFSGDWEFCPCWDVQKCAFKKWGEYPSFCLESIQLNEVTNPLSEILEIY